MPNWCDNSVTVQGPKENLDSFYEAMKYEGDFRLLRAFIPASDYHSTDVGYNNGGYEWCIATWGTKWSESELQVHYAPNGIDMTFETAWTPPLSGIAKIAAMWPTLTFSVEWSEPGMQFVGAAIYRGDHSVLVEDEFSFDGDGEDWLAFQAVMGEARDACAQEALSQAEGTVS
jgi:hypothetical protein